MHQQKNLIEFFALFSLLGRCCKVRNFLSHDGYFFGEGIFDWVRTALFIKCHFFRWHAIVKAILKCTDAWGRDQKPPFLAPWAGKRRLTYPIFLEQPFKIIPHTRARFSAFAKVIRGLFWLTWQVSYTSCHEVSFFKSNLLLYIQ